MKLWVLSRRDHCGYDEYDGFVVIAETETVARAFAASNAADEGGGTWLSDEHSSCTETTLGKPGMILGSFNAG